MPYDAADGTWTGAHVVLASFFTLLNQILTLFDVDVPLSSIFATTTGILEAVVQLLTVLIGSGLIYFLARQVNAPIIGFSRSGNDATASGLGRLNAAG